MRLRASRRIVVGLGALVLVGATAPLVAAAEGDVTGFPVPTSFALPHGVAVGSDGALWFTERLADQIGRLHDGSFVEYPLPVAGSDPTAIVPGPDGNLWFIEQGTDAIGRITTAGMLDEFPLAPGRAPAGIAAGPDGALWFTERAASRIGRITTDGAVLTEWPTLTANAAPTGIAAGPDGALWFTERSAAKLGRITTDGALTEFDLPAGSLPSSVATGPDGRLWVSLRGTNSIARVSTSGVLEATFPIPTAGAQPSHLVPGPQGALWFTESATHAVGRITVEGTITEFPLAAGASPQGIVEGPDGAIWLAEANANRIARLEVGGPVDTTAPTIEIAAPAMGTPVVRGSGVTADFACHDEDGGSGVTSCTGTVADGETLSDGALGAAELRVYAQDAAGNAAEASRAYLVFDGISGSLLEPDPRPGAWLTLSLGMDLHHHLPEPPIVATTRAVSCDDGAPLGDEEATEVRERTARGGSLDVRWHTDRSWAGTCRTLTLAFDADGWRGAPVSFPVAWGAAATKDRPQAS